MTKELEAEDIELKEYSFTPSEIEINGTKILDYTCIEHDRIYLCNKKDILDKPRPSWIPEFDAKGLALDKFLPICVKDFSDGNYFVQSKVYTEERDSNGKSIYKNQIYKMSPDVLAATVDYYLKRKRAELKRKGSTEKVSLPRGMNSMPTSRYKEISKLCLLCNIPSLKYKDIDKSITDKAFELKGKNPGNLYHIQNNVVFLEQWQPLLENIKGKRLDMNYQKQDYIDSYSKALETAYGDSNTFNNLYKDFGVKIKKQNGSNFSKTEVDKLSETIEKVFNHYGNLSNLASGYKLKISYADNCMQFARKAIGLFTPYQNTIGVSFFDEVKQTSVAGENHLSDVTLAHEVAHWLDSQKGKESHNFFASDKYGTLENKIATKFKEEIKKRDADNKMAVKIGKADKKELGEYWFRTCECFARAMEQSYAISQGIDLSLELPYATDKFFKEEIQPLINELMEENRKLFGLENTFIRGTSLSKENESDEQIYNESFEYYKNTITVSDYPRFELMLEDIKREREYFSKNNEKEGSQKRLLELKAKEDFINSVSKEYKRMYEEAQNNISDKDYIYSTDFKTKFGDWEKVLRLEKARNSENIPVDVTLIKEDENLSAYKKNAIAYGKTLFGDYLNEDRNEIIHFSGSKKNGGLYEVLEHDYKDIEHLQSISAIPEMIRKAVYITSLENEDKVKHPSIDSYDYYLCGLDFNGKKYTAKIVIASINGNKYYDHKLTGFEKGHVIDMIKEKSSQVSSASITTQTLKTESLYIKDTRLLQICQCPQFYFLTEDLKPSHETVKKIKDGTLFLEINENGFQSLVDKTEGKVIGKKLQEYADLILKGNLVEIKHPFKSEKTAWIISTNNTDFIPDEFNNWHITEPEYSNLLKKSSGLEYFPMYTPSFKSYFFETKYDAQSALDSLRIHTLRDYDNKLLSKNKNLNFEKENKTMENKNETTEMTQAEKDSKFLIETYGDKKAVDAACKKASISDFISTDKTKYFLNGIYYEKGFAVATNGRVLIKQKKSYPAEWEGKIIDPNTGKEIEGDFPAYEKVFPSKENLVDRSERLAHIEKYLSYATVANALKQKTRYSEDFVPVVFDNTLVNSDYLQLALAFVRDKGFNKCYQEDNYDIKTEPVLDENGNKIFKYYNFSESSNDGYSHKYYSYDELPENVKKVAGYIDADNTHHLIGKIDGTTWFYDEVERQVKEYDNNPSKLLTRTLQFDSPDGSSILIMPLSDNDKPYIDKDGILHNYEESTFIKGKLLGKNDDFYKNIVRTLLKDSHFADADIDGLFKSNFEEALSKQNPDVFPKNKKDCQILATVMTYTDAIGKNLDKTDFVFAPGQSSATLQQFICNLWIEKFKDYVSHPGHLFITGRSLNPEYTIDFAKQKNIIKEKELDFGELVNEEVGEALNTAETIEKENKPMEENTKTSFNLSTNSYIDYFVKSTAEFDAFADFKPITRLGKVEAVEKYKELQDKGISCGIGIDIRNDLIFDTPEGSGITVLIRNEDGKDTLNIMGDSFIKELKSPDQHSLDVVLAFENIYNEAKKQGLNIEEAPYIEEKKQELFSNLPRMTLVNGDIVVGSESLPQNNRTEELRYKEIRQTAKEENYSLPFEFISNPSKLESVHDYQNEKDYYSFTYHNLKADIINSMFGKLNMEEHLNKMGSSDDITLKFSFDKVTESFKYFSVSFADKDGYWISEYFPGNDFMNEIISKELIKNVKNRVNDFDFAVYLGKTNKLTPETDWKADTALITEIKQLDISSHPSSSMWGSVQTCNKIAPGVYNVSTSSHGGLMIHQSVASKMLSDKALEYCSDFSNGFYQYEEDSDIAVPMLELYKKHILEGFKWNEGKQGELFILNQNTAGKYMPEYLASFISSYMNKEEVELIKSKFKQSEEKIINNIEIKPVSLEEILGVMEMRPEITPEGKIKVFDLQRQEYIDNRSDLPPFDEDNWTFNNAGEVFERLDVYINDYYVHDMQEQLEEAGREITGDETLSDLCSIYKTELEKGNDKLSLSVLNLAMGIVNPETVIMFENEKKLEINQEKEIHPEFIILDADDKSISELKEHLADNGYDVKWQEKDAENSYVRFTCDIDDKEYIQTILEDRNIYYHSKMGLTSLGFDGKWVDDPLNVEIVSQEEFKHIQEEKERMLDSAERYAVIDEYLPDTEFFVNAKNMLLDINAWQEGIANFGTSVVELNKFCNKDFKTKSMVEVYAAELEKSLFNLAEACSNGNAFNKEHEIAEKVVKANNSKELFASLKESYMNKNEPIKEGDKVTVSLKTLYEYIAENEGTFLFNDRNCVKTLYGATIEVSDGSEEPKTSYYDLYAKDGTLLCCDGETLVYSGIEEKTGLHTFTNPNNESQYLITLSNEELSVASFGISFVTQRIKDGVEYNTLPSTSLSDFDHDKFKKLYSESYNRYYNAEDKETHAEQSENMKQFDFLMKYNKDFKEAVQALVAERHDPYSSDRECAAVVYSFRILGIDLTLSTMELADAICQEGYEQSASGFMTSFSFSEIAELAGRDEDWVRDNLKEICEALATHNDELLLDFNEREALAEPGELEINFCSVGEDYNELFKKDDNGRWIRKTDAELRMEGFENGVLGELSYDHHTFIDEQKINFLEFPKVFNTPKSLGLSEKEHFAYYQYELSLNQIKTIASAESDIVKIVEKNTDSPEQLDVHFVFDREHNKLSDFYIRYNKNNNTYTSSYVAGEVRESDISKNMQENLCKIFEKVFKINQEIQTGAAEEVQSVSLSDLPVEELREGLKYALNEVAQPLPEIDFTRENYNKLFPRDRLNTPIETVKIGAHQFEKLEVKDRKNLLQAVHDVLSNPDLIINEEKESIFGDMENSHVYAKSYVINEKTKAVQSVVVNIEDEYISISTHKRDISNVVNKIKKPDQLLFAAAKVRLLVEQHTKEKLSQSVVNPNRENEYIIPPQTNITQTPEKSSDEKSIDSFNIKGRKYSFSDAEALLKEDIAAIFEELDSSEIEQNLTLNGVKIYGNPEKDGKIKLLVEFDSKNPENRWSEDSLFNAIGDENITFNGMEVDVNPITPEKSGTIEEYLSRLERLDAVSEAEAIEKQAELIASREEVNNDRQIDDVLESVNNTLDSVLDKKEKILPFSIIDNTEKGRVNIKFDTVENNGEFQNILKELKSNGWKFAPSTKQWYPIGKAVAGAADFANRLQEKYSIPLNPGMETAMDIGSKKSAYDGIRFFDRNYNESKEFADYFNSHLSELGENKEKISEKDASVILKAIGYENKGILGNRNNRLGLDKNNRLVILTKNNSAVQTHAIDLQGILDKAKEKSELDLKETEKMVNSKKTSSLPTELEDLFSSMFKECLNENKAVYQKMQVIYNAYAQKKKIPDLSVGEKLGSDTVSDVYKISDGVYQATMNCDDSGVESVKNYFVIDNSIAGQLDSELKELVSSFNSRSVIKNKTYEPYILLDLITKKIMPPRDENFVQKLNEYISNHPLKYEKLKPVHSLNFEQKLKEIAEIDKQFNKTPFELGKKLISLVDDSDKESLNKWLSSKGCTSEENMAKVFASWIKEEPEQKKNMNKKKDNGYPPRGEK